MTISVTNLQILDTLPILRELASGKFSSATGFRLARIIKAVEDIAQTYIKAQFDLANRYGDKDESGKLIVVDDKISFKHSPENAGLFMGELNNLNAVVNEIPGSMLKEADFAGAEIEPGKVLALQWLIQLDV